LGIDLRSWAFPIAQRLNNRLPAMKFQVPSIRFEVVVKSQQRSSCSQRGDQAVADYLSESEDGGASRGIA